MVSRRSTGELLSRLNGRISRRVVIIGMGLAIWVGIVVLAAGEEPDGTHWVGVPSLGSLFTALAGLAMIAGFVVLVFSMISRRNSDLEIPERKPVWPLIIVLVFVLVLVSRLDRQEPVAKEAEVLPSAQVETDGVDRRETPVITASELGMLLVAMVLSIAFVGWSRRRLQAVTTASDGDDDQLQDELVPIVDEAAHRLEVGSDPRAAVMLAYAGVEGALADLGHPPQPTETPTEYLARVLKEVVVDPTPLVDLARLHELARFSDHPISHGDQQEAAAALRRVRSELSRVD